MLNLTLKSVILQKKHSSVNLEKLPDNNSNIPTADDVKSMEEGQGHKDETNHVTNGSAVVSNGTDT